MPHESAVRTAALIRHNMLLLLREPGPLASRLVLPLAFLVMLLPLYRAAQGEHAGTVQAVTGSLVTFSLLALSIVGSSILSERIGHTWERLRASAAHPAELLVGKGLPVMATLLVQQTVVVGFGVLVLGMRVEHAYLLGGVLLCWTSALLGIGTALGGYARSFGELSAGYDIGGMILSSLGGALVPLSELPLWVRAIAPASPGYWAVSALRAALAGDAATAAGGCGVLLGIALLAGTAAAVRINRGLHRSAKP
jgi:ABC-2 type transport system permease protein